MSYQPPHHGQRLQAQPARYEAPEVFNGRNLTFVAAFWIAAGVTILLAIIAAGDRFPPTLQIASAGRLRDVTVDQMPTGNFLIGGWIVIAVLGLMLLGGVLRRRPGTGQGQLLQLIVIILGAVLVPGFLPVVIATFAAGEYPSSTGSELTYVFSFILILPSLILSLLAIRKPKAR
ncbi:hypothetical protein V5R04_02910 [Jonesiaceae bacterium BS-20]|uniref:DUF805 domain-containing protein n=1 Tax=Jonesiaceae bacterium BS-20 TaxID=3120821 RepID=A0AAU7DWV5_9MICO